jgi:Protein of unknown function (DUF3788)
MGPTAFMDTMRAPTAKEIADALGPAAGFWKRLTRYVEQSYDIEPVFGAPSKNYGWDVKYRKGGRTLVSLTPDRGEFTALVVLGAAESDAARDLELGDHVRRVFDEAKPLHDGRWLFIKVESDRDVDDVEALLAVKRRPRAQV